MSKPNKDLSLAPAVPGTCGWCAVPSYPKCPPLPATADARAETVCGSIKIGGLWSQEEQVPQVESLTDAPEDRAWLALRGTARGVR